MSTTPMMHGVMFGLTHNRDLSPIVRPPKVLKVGIGIPKGPALNVWINAKGEWRIQRGYAKEGKANAAQTTSVKTKKDAIEMYYKHLPTAPNCNYPRKLPYFTFTRSTMHEGAELFVPDFDTIEAHGPTPTEIDIILLDDQPFQGSYQMWSTSELRCKGDGVNAMRVLSMASGAEELALAKAAKDDGEKLFPIIDGCWTMGCPYSRPTMEGGKEIPALCKPGGDLRFQVANNIRLGGTAFFHTGGFRSISSIFSSIYQIGVLTGGRLEGIPLKMVLRPFKSNHNGQSATQYAVSLEFRAPDVESMKIKLMQSVFEFRKAIGGGTPAQRQLPAPIPALTEGPEVATAQGAEEDDDDQPMSASAMVAEFGGIEEDDGPGPETQQQQDDPGSGAIPAAVTAAAGTQEKIASMADKLKQASAAAKRGTEPASAPATDTGSAPPPAGVKLDPNAVF